MHPRLAHSWQAINAEDRNTSLFHSFFDGRYTLSVQIKESVTADRLRYTVPAPLGNLRVVTFWKTALAKAGFKHFLCLFIATYFIAKEQAFFARFVGDMNNFWNMNTDLALHPHVPLFTSLDTHGVIRGV
jgi:hypothetical protein